MISLIDPFTARCYFVNMLHNLVDPEFCKHSIDEMQVPLSETDRRLWNKIVALLAERDRLQSAAKEMAEALDHMPAISQGHLKIKDAALSKFRSL